MSRRVQGFTKAADVQSTGLQRAEELKSLMAQVLNFDFNQEFDIALNDDATILRDLGPLNLIMGTIRNGSIDGRWHIAEMNLVTDSYA